MKTLLIDGPNLIRRIYAVYHKNNKENKEPSAIANNVTASIKRAINTHQPTHGIIVHEHQAKSWRHQLYPDYKSNRPAVPADLLTAMPEIESAIKQIPFNNITIASFEADDVIATFATKIAAHNGHSIVLTTDLNQCQIMSERIMFYHHFDRRPITLEDIINRFGVAPQQLPDFLALTGDTSSSIQGVTSVGKKTAAKLISSHGSLQQLLNNLDAIGGSIGNKLRQEQDNALLAKQLFSLKTDIDIGINLKALRIKGANL